MSIPLDTRADSRVAPTDRAAAVLRTLNQALGGMAAGIPEPKLAGPLGYFADAAAWAGHCLQSDERMQANEKVIDELIAEARAVLEQTEAAPPTGRPDQVGATLEALVLASPADPGTKDVLERLLATLAYVETGRPAGPEEHASKPGARGERPAGDDDWRADGSAGGRLPRLALRRRPRGGGIRHHHRRWVLQAHHPRRRQGRG